VRTTLTLDDDVATKVRREMARSGRSLKETINSLLRLSLNRRPAPRPQARFKVAARSLGLRAGLSLDNLGDLLEQVEGPLHK
jgi:hypothetical protein